MITATRTITIGQYIGSEWQGSSCYYVAPKPVNERARKAHHMLRHLPTIILAVAVVLILAVTASA